MGYYHIPLDEESQRLVPILPWETVSTPLPMGVASAPDIFQSIMDSLLCDLPFWRVYMMMYLSSNGTFKITWQNRNRSQTNQRYRLPQMCANAIL
jgi:hypothetical protein